jgi:hypothetical protein
MLSRQRWGTFSVKDHLMSQAFVSDVLLFDRLVVPYPANENERNRWSTKNWQPDKLDELLELLGDRAITFPWYEDLYVTRFSKNIAEIFSKDHLQAAKESHMDPFYLTRQIVAEEEVAKHQNDYIKIWTMPAYPSRQAFKDRPAQTPAEKKEELAFVIANHFLTPHDPTLPDQTLLTEALELSKRDDFIEKRNVFRKWQEDVLEDELTPQQAVREMENSLEELQAIMKKSKVNMASKVSFLVVEAALGLAGAHLGDPLATASAMVSIAKFWRFEKKPEIKEGSAAIASMIYTSQHSLHWD